MAETLWRWLLLLMWSCSLIDDVAVAVLLITVM